MPENPYLSWALQYHTWGANVTAKRRDSKGIIHKWEHLRTTRQSEEELRAYRWGTAGGVGVITGVGGWRVFDIDHASAAEPVRALLTALGLPADYQWSYQSGSGAGYGVVICCDETMPNDALPAKKKEASVFWGYPPEGGAFDHLELRWNQHCVLPPSSYVFGKGERQGEHGPGYQWLHEPPEAPPETVPIHRVIAAFYALCPPKPHTLGSMPDSLRQDIRNRFDLVAYLQRELGGEVQRDGREVRLLGHGGLLIDQERGVWHAFSEEIGGDAFDAVAYCRYRTLARNLNGKSAEVLQLAADYAGVTIPPRIDAPSAPPPDPTLVSSLPQLDDQSYFVHNGGIWYRPPAGNGKMPLPMTNWTATIVAEVSVSDGASRPTELYELSAICQGRTKALEISRREFEGDGAIGQIVASLGARARINPLAQPRFIIDAIKTLSTTPEARHIYTHTGWVDGKYLFCNGYVDASGWHEAASDTAVRAHLPEKLARYRMAPNGTVEEGLDLFSTLLSVAPTSVMVPLVGAVLLAPLLAALATAAPLVHLSAPTGSFKTALCCAALSLFGDFAEGPPTETWTSTANSIQRVGWHLLHAPMLLDDYKQKNVKESAVVFLLQNYGDNMARGRLDSDANLKNTYPIRGVMISSGEDQPEGEASTLARMLTVGLNRNEVSRVALTQIQEQSHRMHALTLSYLQWLAQNPAALGCARERQRQIRNEVITEIETPEATNPGRVASNVAALLVSWEMFSQFCVEAGLWRAADSRGWLATCRAALVNLAQNQMQATAGERYSSLFLDALRGLLASGKATLLPSRDTKTGASDVLGAIDAEGIYLIAQAAYDAVASQMRTAGRTVGFSIRALSQMLDQEGLLISKTRGAYVRMRINGTLCYCWHLSPSILE